MARCPRLCIEFQKHAKNTGESSQNMNHIQAGIPCKARKTRTGIQRKHEVEDVDINSGRPASFIELQGHDFGRVYKRHEKDPWSTGRWMAGHHGRRREGWRSWPSMPAGLSPQPRGAPSLARKKRARRRSMNSRRKPRRGVKGMAARQELESRVGDETETNKLELTLAAAKGRPRRRVVLRPSRISRRRRRRRPRPTRSEGRR